MRKTFPTIAFCILLTVPAAAQEGTYRYLDATQLWRLTQNAAGLSLDMPQQPTFGHDTANDINRGFAEFNLQHSSGDYHRVQEGGQRNQLGFLTERYQSIGHFLVGYGRFAFDMDRTKQRAWCDVMRPYNANPFFAGSNVAGKYDTQQFDLSAAIATVPIPLSGDRADRELTLGARLDYKVGDMSRLRDPRSRSELLQYRLSPAATYVFGRHTLGLSGHYDRRKEKLPGLTTVQEDPNLMYYVMTGMEQATGTVAGYKGFSREWVCHELGTEVAYAYRRGQVHSLNTVGIARANEDAWGQYKYSPGKYTSYIYSAATRNRIGDGNLLHEIDAVVTATEGSADEYRQQLVQERNADNGYTSFRYNTQITYRKRYQVQTLDLTLHYRLNNLHSNEGSPRSVEAYGGVIVALQRAHNKHLLPTSQSDYRRLDCSLEGGCALFGQRLWLDATAGYSPSLKADLSLADEAASPTDYATQVLIPDLAYYEANFMHGSLSLKYLFPLHVKGKKSQAYVKAYGQYLHTDNSLNRQTVGLTFGLYN